MRALRPRRLIPTVNAGDPAAARAIVDRFAGLMDLSRDRSRLDRYLLAGRRGSGACGSGPSSGPASMDHPELLSGAGEGPWMSPVEDGPSKEPRFALEGDSSEGPSCALARDPIEEPGSAAAGTGSPAGWAEAAEPAAAGGGSTHQRRDGTASSKLDSRGPGQLAGGKDQPAEGRGWQCGAAETSPMEVEPQAAESSGSGLDLPQQQGQDQQQRWQQQQAKQTTEPAVPFGARAGAHRLRGTSHAACQQQVQVEGQPEADVDLDAVDVAGQHRILAAIQLQQQAKMSVPPGSGGRRQLRQGSLRAFLMPGRANSAD